MGQRNAKVYERREVTEGECDTDPVLGDTLEYYGTTHALGGEQRVDNVMRLYFSKANASFLARKTHEATGYLPSADAVLEAMVHAFEMARPNMPDPMEDYDGLTPEYLQYRVGQTVGLALEQLIPETLEANRMWTMYARDLAGMKYGDDELPCMPVGTSVRGEDVRETDYRNP